MTKKTKVSLSFLLLAILGGLFLYSPTFAQEQEEILTKEHILLNFPGLSVGDLENTASTMKSFGAEYQENHLARLGGTRHLFPDQQIIVDGQTHTAAITVGENYGGVWDGNAFIANAIERVYNVRRSEQEGWSRYTSLVYYEQFDGDRNPIDSVMWLEYPGHFPENAAIRATIAGPMATVRSQRGSRFKAYISRGHFRDAENRGYYAYYIRFSGEPRDPSQYFYAVSDTNIYAVGYDTEEARSHEKVELILPFRHTSRSSNIIWRIKLIFDKTKRNITFRHLGRTTAEAEAVRRAAEEAEAARRAAEEEEAETETTEDP